MNPYGEDELIQGATAKHFTRVLHWEEVYAYNEETFGAKGTLGRMDDTEVVLTRYLHQALAKLNPGLPELAYQIAVEKITAKPLAQALLQTNHEKYQLIKEGVVVEFRNDKGEQEKQRLKIFDYANPTNNHFLIVREMWIQGPWKRRRPDVLGYVNGLPLLFIELKALHKDLRVAYEENLINYKADIPHLFHHNAMIILANGEQAKLGSLSSQYKHFREWKRMGEEDEANLDMVTLLNGICEKSNFMDLFENFILFDESSGRTVKILAQNHQFMGVNRAVEALKDRKAREGKLGVFWHTQGAGKSYSMVFFTAKARRKLGGNFTFLICTDRDDLDEQIYKTFAGCGLADNDKEKCRASSGKHLKELLGQHKAFVFTMIWKFNQKVAPGDYYSKRDDIIVITDEAHRTQYGTLALNMRNALPNAGFIGFTGTPLFKNDEITRKVFGGYVSKYSFGRAVDDEATVPLYYDARGEKLEVTTNEINEKIAEALEAYEGRLDQDTTELLEKEMGRDYHIITSDPRLKAIAEDFVEHYSTAWETGKAMFVCIDKITCVKMYDLIQVYWQKKINKLEKQTRAIQDEQEESLHLRKIEWMKETQMAVVISEEPGEYAKFEKWGLDIKPHRQRIQEGFPGLDGENVAIDEAFKKPEHPFRVVIVCAMWLTGFDVPSLANLYLDKPLKAHTLMQTIARANRVYEGKANGMIIDYCGGVKSLREALSMYGGGDEDAGAGNPGKPEGNDEDPLKTQEELLASLGESIHQAKIFLKERGYDLKEVIESEPASFERVKAIRAAKEAINQNDESRKRFGVIAREVFNRFKTCLNNREGINQYRNDRDAINAIYKSLEEDRDKADISDIIRDLHAVVNESIEVRRTENTDSKLLDISQIDFDRLKGEFAKSPTKNTTIQNLKDVIDQRLQRMLRQNPLRTDFQKKYNEIVEQYNRDIDRAEIERIFEALLKFNEILDEEDHRAIREGLGNQPDDPEAQEALAMFDLLKKPELSKKEIEQIKSVAKGLLAKLKEEKLKADSWREKQATRDAVKNEIYNFLYSDQTGLPDPAYSPEEVEAKAKAVFVHLLMVA